MALSDAQVERYSRQILLPEIGGRGQERMLDARIALAGSGAAAIAAATLLGRAGIGALDLLDEALDLPELSPDCRVGRHRRFDDGPPPDVLIDLGHDTVGRAGSVAARRGPVLGPVLRPVFGPVLGPVLVGTLDGTRASLLTLVGRPCIRCMPAELVRPADAAHGGPLASSAALALGALAATEALRVLLLPPRRGRHIVTDLATGELESFELEPTAVCAACGSDA